MVAVLLISVGWAIAGPRVNEVLVSKTVGPDTLETSEEVGEQVLEQMIDLGSASPGGADVTTDDIASTQEMLHELAVWKLDVNRADEDALQSLPGLTPQDAARIVSYRKEHGPFRQLSELLRAGLAAETVDAILPFLTIDERPSVSKRLSVKAEVVQRWTRRITQVAGQREDTTGSRYLGGADALMTRFRMKIGRHITVGGTLEKDAGEPMHISKGALGHDFGAGYGVISDLGPFHRIILGDYAANVGEGLALGQSSTMGVGPRSLRVREMLRPHSSSREYGYFRGFAVQTKPLFGLQAAITLSRKDIDARLDSASGIWSFASNGLHRTETERSKSDSAFESMLGWILSYRGSQVRVGFAGSSTQRTAGPQTVSRNRSISSHAAWSGSIVGVSTEVALRDSVFAVSGGLAVEPTRSTQFWLQWLYSSAGGGAPHSTVAVDSRGVAQRERRWLAGVTLRPSRRIAWSFSSRSARKPAHAMEGESFYVTSALEADVRPWLALRLRIVDQRNDQLDACTADRRVLRCSSLSSRRSLRLQVDYEHSRTLRNRFQIEVSRGTSGPSEARRHGVLLYKDVRWRPSRTVQIDGRIVFFEVTDFAARIYAFENDLLYSFSAPVFSGRGRRSYVILRLAPHRSLTVQVKYSVSSYEDVRSIGSGLDATDEPSRKDVRVQLRWKIGGVNRSGLIERPYLRAILERTIDDIRLVSSSAVDDRRRLQMRLV